MKRIITAVFLLGAIVATAQDKGKNEVRVGFSDAIFIHIGSGLANAFGESISSGITGVQYKDAKTKAVGMFEAGYRYHLNERFKIGADISFLQTEDTFDTKSTNSTDIVRKSTYNLVLITGEFNYVKTSLLTFYASGGAGIISMSTKEVGGTYKDNLSDFAFQINPVGLRVGKSFGGFAELGFGYKGIISAGVNYKF